MIKFTKMHGLGNDYVYMDAIHQKIENITTLAKFVSDRHFGIGSDGLILICESKVADFKMRMFNSDGSEAEMCGNGIRCVGKFVYDKGLTTKQIVTIETLAGIKTLNLNTKDGKVQTARVDMGEPILEASKIPVISEEMPVQNLKLKAIDKEFTFTCVSMGNPHCVVFMDDVENFEIEKTGPLFENYKDFPNRINTEFVKVIDEHTLQMRVWERGSGETLACGTGACATAVAAVLNGHCNGEILIHLLGVDLKIEWDKETNHVFMTGPAAISFEGEINL